MVELGYFAMGFVAGMMFMLTALVIIGRQINKHNRSIEQQRQPPPVQPIKKQETMWN